MESSIYGCLYPIGGRKHWYLSENENGKKITTEAEVDDEGKKSLIRTYENGKLMNCEVKMIEYDGGATDDSKVSDNVGKGLEKWYENVEIYLQRINSDMALRDPTPGDGNCFYHAVLDQINLLGIEDVPESHHQLRLAVCDSLPNLPQEMKNQIGEARLEELAGIHSQNGVWAAQEMIQAMAYFLNRNIIIYSPNDAIMSQTKIDGGDGADQKAALTVFYHGQHYQSIARNFTE